MAAPVGVVGLGRMGSAIAAKVGESRAVLGWDVRDLPEAPAPLAPSPAALFERCEVVVCCLPSPVETRAVLLEPTALAALRGGAAVVVDTSTSDPASSAALAADLGGAAGRLVDAPILGRPDTCGAWTMPAGGAADAVERARPVLELVARTVEHVGPLGSGQAIKLLNNLMFAAINVITAEAVGACERLGVDAERFVGLVAGSAAATVSPLFRDLAPRMLGDDLGTVFTVALLDKDLRLAVRMCEDAGVPLIAARALQIALARALDEGLGARDTASLVRLYRTPVAAPGGRAGDGGP